MKTKNTFYVTTPIYYPNDKPHIGHAYTTIAGDILARWNKLQKKDVFFLAGTDEHGKKIENAALQAKKTPQTFVNNLVPEFKEAWKKLNIQYDRFIRTTDPDHEQVVQVILAESHKKGDIYEGYYEGFYCTACETYYTEKDLEEGCCPIHKTRVEKLKEESYFFKISKYQNKLLDFYKKNPDFISPDYRKKEIINRVKEGLQDLSISRTSFKWGIPLPFDKDHVCYVWFDALANYLTGVGYLEDKKMFKKFWPADLHLVGKDILWFHAVIWPAMLLSLGIPPPKKIFAHGWWTFNKEKISKSRGKVINVQELINLAGVDSARYFLFREVPFGEDGDFSAHDLIERHNNELADKLGNLVSRVSTLAESNGLQITKPLDSKPLQTSIAAHFENLAFDKALNEIFAFIDSINEYIQKNKPWETKDKKILWQTANAIKDIAILLSPFMPETAEKIAKTFNFELTQKSLQEPLKIAKIKKAEILFKKKDTMPKKTENKKTENTPNKSTFKEVGAIVKDAAKKIAQDVNKTVTQAMQDTKEILDTKKSTVNYKEFSKSELKVGKIIDVKDHPDADKLLILTVDVGEPKNRTIIAGLKKHYKKEDLKGKKAIFVTNLEPATLRGIVSEGMLLAAVSDDETKVIILQPEKDIESGSKIR